MINVQMLAPEDDPLPSGAVQTYPAGWSGEVPDHLALAWHRKGSCQLVASDPSILTPQETAVLKLAANEILAHQAAQTGAADPAPAETDAPLDLEDLTTEELQQLAKTAKVPSWSKLKRVDLIDRLRALEQPASAETVA